MQNVEGYNYLKKHDNFSFKKKQLFKRLKINLKNYDKFKYELKKLIDLDYIAKTRGGKYVHVSSDEFIEGILHISKTGKGFVDNESGSVFIGTNKFLGALNGDKVKVKI